MSVFIYGKTSAFFCFLCLTSKLTYGYPWRASCRERSDQAGSVTRVAVRCSALFGLIFCDVGLGRLNKLLNNIKISDGSGVVNGFKCCFVAESISWPSFGEDFDKNGLAVGNNPDLIILPVMLKFLCIHGFKV